MLNFPMLKVAHEVYGTEYGQWPIVGSRVTPNNVIYSFGCGTDISWDLAVIQAHGVTVHAFDPTPVSLDYIRKHHAGEMGFVFTPVGLSDKNETLKLSSPIVTGGSSFYKGKLDDTEVSIAVPCQDLKTIMSSLGHRYVDILKMDIEGSEYAVINYMIEQAVLPQQLMIEFHHDMYGYSVHDTQASVDRLVKAGYSPYYRSSTGRELAFLRSR